MFDWRRPTNLGVTEGRLAACRTTPNCVSSQADPSDREHYIAPIPFKGTPAQAIGAARQAVQSMERATIVSEAPGYLYGEFRSKLMGYVDDVEFFFDEKAGVFHVRSASRLGRRDFGVNRKRIDSLREKLSR